MPAKPYTALSIAVSSGTIGFTFFIDDELCDWGLASQACKSEEQARKKVKAWITFYKPDLIVTEKLTLHSRKRGQSLRNIEAIAEVTQATDAHHIEVERIQQYDNKYVEAEALVERHPAIANWKPPKRKLWESEDDRMVMFEALSLMGRAQ